MQIISKFLLFSPVLLVLSTSVNADINKSGVDDNSTKYDTGYAGIKGGLLMVSDSIAKDIDNPINYGAYLGYRFNKDFGVEIDYTNSKEASVTNASGDKGTYDVATYGTYVTYHYPINNTSLYAKAKLGVGGAEIDEKYNANKQSADDIGVSGGLSLGIHLYKNMALETELNMLRTDNIHINTLTLGAQFAF